jgi:hypothetical protein
VDLAGSMSRIRTNYLNECLYIYLCRIITFVFPISMKRRCMGVGNLLVDGSILYTSLRPYGCSHPIYIFASSLICKRERLC